MRTHARIDILFFALLSIFVCVSSAFATTKGLSQIVTPDLQDEAVKTVLAQAELLSAGWAEA